MRVETWRKHLQGPAEELLIQERKMQERGHIIPG